MFIRSAASISPQASFSQLLTEPAKYSTNRLTCIEPDYAKILDPKLIRRMSHIIKMGVAAAMACLKESDVQNPDAIIAGTAYGCLADTESFLTKMVENKEELLTPTAFIQSTHNTVAAQIALMIKCHNYNNTFVHRGVSFENALLDAIALMHEEEASTVLAGGVDEITNVSHEILSRFGLYKKDPVSNLDIFKTSSKGTIDGEGAAFFVLCRQASGNDYAKLDGIHTFYKPADVEEVKKNIENFLSSQGINVMDIDLVIQGRNGDLRNDGVYGRIGQELFPHTAKIDYKHLCGEYPTSSAFALWLAANILKTGKIPSIALENPKKILFYNHYQNIHHSLFLLSAC